MAIFKCKMCGGDLDVLENQTVIECEYCGTNQTVPTSRDEEITNLFNRAELLRKKCDFDRAEATYEKILELDSKEAEAYWGVILCKYGIEYVDDPKTKTKIPTCHRTSYDAIVTDEYYKQAILNSDVVQRAVYEKEACRIDEIQKGILQISMNEKPYDVFISYKETDEYGRRTKDSALANEIYYELKNEGFKVFYSAITLEDRLGEEYEPYIFSALNSAKVMLVIGTKAEHFNSVWVKNEWSRFLKLIKKDRSKKLIPCYRDMDAYDLPEEFAHLQAQDMSKIGFITDIVRGIKKLINTDTRQNQPSAENESQRENTNYGASAFLRRAQIFLEEGDFANAGIYVEKCLDIEPENSDAYLAKLLVQLRLRGSGELKHQKYSFSDNFNYQMALRYGDAWQRKSLMELCNERDYNEAKSLCQKGDEASYSRAKELLVSLGAYKDCKELLYNFTERLERIERLELKEETDRNLLKCMLVPVAEEACKVASQQKKVNELKVKADPKRRKACRRVIIASILFVLSIIIIASSDSDGLNTIAALLLISSGASVYIFFFIYLAKYAKKYLLPAILIVIFAGIAVVGIPFLMIYESNKLKKSAKSAAAEERALTDLKKQFNRSAETLHDDATKQMIMALASQGSTPEGIATLIAEKKIDYV